MHKYVISRQVPTILAGGIPALAIGWLLLAACSGTTPTTSPTDTGAQRPVVVDQDVARTVAQDYLGLPSDAVSAAAGQVAANAAVTATVTVGVGVGGGGSRGTSGAGGSKETSGQGGSTASAGGACDDKQQTGVGGAPPKETGSGGDCKPDGDDDDDVRPI